MLRILLIAGLVGALSPAAMATLNFDLSVYQELEPRKTQNAVFSPYSLDSALGLIYLGTRGGTRNEIQKATGFSDEHTVHLKNYAKKLATMTTSKGVILLAANGIWYVPGTKFEPTWVEQVKMARTTLEETNFAADLEGARRKINGWGKQNTKGLISEVIAPGILNPQTNFILSNAVYFYGPRKDEFKKELTAKLTFDGRTKKSVHDFMNRQGYYGYSESADFQSVEIPYKDADFVMDVVLFRSGQEAKLNETITSAKLKSWIPTTSAEVNLKLPKFEVRSELDLVAPLKSSGIKALFSSAGDFSGAISTGSRSLPAEFYTVRQTAIVKVDEKGTEAAAVTTFGRQITSARPTPKQFVANRPFLFFIRSVSTDTILFMGQIVEL